MPATIWAWILRASPITWAMSVGYSDLFQFAPHLLGERLGLVSERVDLLLQHGVQLLGLLGESRRLGLERGESL